MHRHSAGSGCGNRACGLVDVSVHATVLLHYLNGELKGKKKWGEQRKKQESRHGGFPAPGAGS
jgi:hypothetical protein